MALVLLALLLLTACSGDSSFDIPPLGLLTCLVVGYTLGWRGRGRRLQVDPVARQYREDTRDPREGYRLAKCAEWRRTGKMVPLGRTRA